MEDRPEAIIYKYTHNIKLAETRVVAMNNAG